MSSAKPRPFCVGPNELSTDLTSNVSSANVVYVHTENDL